MRTVPREAFLPEDMIEFAYRDSPLPIAEGQTISQPYIVAVMTEAPAAQIARERYGCLSPWQTDPATYGRAVLTGRFRACDAIQNARLVASAEQYYRIMYYGSVESWNLRDRHMFDTLNLILRFRGPDARAVVWEHNSHVGNAAATEMGARGEYNVGQLCRETLGLDAFLVGFGTDHGTVAAASDWGGPMEIKEVRPPTRTATSVSVTRLRSRPSCCTCASPPATRSSMSSSSHDWSAPSGSSTGRRPSSRATTSRPFCPGSSTSTSGLTRPARSAPWV